MKTEHAARFAASEYLSKNVLCLENGSSHGENMAKDDLVVQLQIHTQQLQSISIQKQTLMLQGKEIEKALEEITKSDGQDIYKAVGPILIKTDKTLITKELDEKKDDIEIKIRILEKQEKKIKEKVQELQDQLRPHVGQGG